jgi:hypothetical protein
MNVLLPAEVGPLMIQIMGLKPFPTLGKAHVRSQTAGKAISGSCSASRSIEVSTSHPVFAVIGSLD